MCVSLHSNVAYATTENINIATFFFRTKDTYT